MAKSKKIKILYIEDDRDVRLLMRKILSRDPFQFMEAAKGLEGLEIALKKRPQIILMDIDLPDIRGDELTTKIKNTKELKDTIVIALSGLKEEHVREKILVAGAAGYLTKPIVAFQFLAHLIAVFFRHHDIQHNGIRRIGLHLFKAFYAIVGYIHRKAFPFQVALNNGSKIRLIVYYQYALLCIHDILLL